MKTKKQNFLALIILFSSTSFITSMEKLTVAPESPYVSLVNQVKNEFPTKNCQKTYAKIKKIVDKCPTTEAKKQLLDTPINEKGERLLHLITKFSTLLPPDLSDTRAVQLTIIHQFLYFLPYCNINIQDNNSNTPLLKAFGRTRNGAIAWCPEVVFLLLGAEAHPAIKNKDEKSPMNYLNEIIEKRKSPDYTPKHPVEELYTELIQNMLYRYM